MKFLITNDDGIDSAGLRELVKWAKNYGEVTVCAPKFEQSGKSQSIEIVKPFEIRSVEFENGVEAYAIDSTPTDCIRFGIGVLKRDYDLVLAGINRGFNIGHDIMYSGTDAAIFEAGSLGFRAIAVSASPDSCAAAVSHLDRVYRYVVDNRLFAYNDIYNVNIPLEPKGIRITRQGGAFYHDEIVNYRGNFYMQEGISAYHYGENFDLDTDAVMNGYISISPLTIERTNKEAFQRLFALNKIHS